MAVDLASHIHEMYNSELNAIAKLRFTDRETQVALANHRYLLCRKYLASNPNLHPEARDVLLAGKANSVKMNLMSAGHLNATPEKISELYYTMKRRGLHWWRQSAFVQNWYGLRRPNTPAAVLQDMFDNHDKHEYGSGRLMASMVSHHNSTLEMAVLASTNENEDIRQAGFARLIFFEKNKETE